MDMLSIHMTCVVGSLAKGDQYECGRCIWKTGIAEEGGKLNQSIVHSLWLICDITISCICPWPKYAKWPLHRAIALNKIHCSNLPFLQWKYSPPLMHPVPWGKWQSGQISALRSEFFVKQRWHLVLYTLWIVFCTRSHSFITLAPCGN